MDPELLLLQVNGLANFPFTSFSEFQQALKNKAIVLGIDRSAALLWMQPKERVRHAPASDRAKALLLSALSYITVLIFAIFVIVKTSWVWLAAIPIFLISFYIFQPSTEKLLFTGPLGKFILFTISTLLWFGLLWGLGFAVSGLVALCLALLVQQFAIKRVYFVAINSLIDAASSSEDLFCRLWRNDVAQIMFQGDCYSNSYVTRSQHTN